MEIKDLVDDLINWLNEMDIADDVLDALKDQDDQCNEELNQCTNDVLQCHSDIEIIESKRDWALSRLDYEENLHNNTKKELEECQADGPKLSVEQKIAIYDDFVILPTCIGVVGWQVSEHHSCETDKITLQQTVETRSLCPLFRTNSFGNKWTGFYLPRQRKAIQAKKNLFGRLLFL